MFFGFIVEVTPPIDSCNLQYDFIFARIAVEISSEELGGGFIILRFHRSVGFLQWHLAQQAGAAVDSCFVLRIPSEYRLISCQRAFRLASLLIKTGQCDLDLRIAGAAFA